MTTSVISITNTCNFKCKTCDIGQKNNESSGLVSNWTSKSEDILSPVEWNKIFINTKSNVVHLMGVEPLLYPHLEELLSLSGASRKIFLTTNGWFISKYIDSISTYCNDIAISIDGLQGTNDSIRGITGAFDRAFEGAKELKKRGKKVRISYTITSDNIEDMIPFYQEASEKYKIKVCFNHYNYIHEQSCKGLSCSPSCMKIYNPANYDIEKINDAVAYCKNAKFLPKLKVEEVRKYYTEAPLRYRHSKNGCVVLESFLKNNRFAIASNGDFILPGRCWYNLGYLGNALKMDILPKNSSKIKKIVSNIRKKGFPPPCQRLCCAGKII